MAKSEAYNLNVAAIKGTEPCTNIHMHMLLWQEWVSPSFVSQNCVHPRAAVIFVCPLCECSEFDSTKCFFFSQLQECSDEAQYRQPL